MNKYPLQVSIKSYMEKFWGFLVFNFWWSQFRVLRTENIGLKKTISMFRRAPFVFFDFTSRNGFDTILQSLTYTHKILHRKKIAFGKSKRLSMPGIRILLIPSLHPRSHTCMKVWANGCRGVHVLALSSPLGNPGHLAMSIIVLPVESRGFFSSLR